MSYMVVFAVATSLRESNDTDGVLCGPRADYHYGTAFWMFVSAFLAASFAFLGLASTLA